MCPVVLPLPGPRIKSWLLSCTTIRGRVVPESNRFACFSTPLSSRSQPVLLLLILLSGGVLLLGALGSSGAVAALAGWPAWPTLAAQGGVAAGLFMLVRRQPSRLRGQNFVGVLRRLLLGPGLAAGLGLGLFAAAWLLGRARPALAPAAHALAYPLIGGLFFYFLAKTNYAWRALLFFKSDVALRKRWHLLEGLLGLVLLGLLVVGPVPAWLGLPVLVGLGLLGLYLSSNQRWVAYLTQNQKWQAIGYQAIILGLLLLAAAYFRSPGPAAGPPAPAAQHTFLLLTAGFAGFYSLMGLLVTVFSLPTAGVFEQRQAEVMGLQRLTQIIQRGQTAAEIYQTLLDSAVQTVRAEAAGLLLRPGTSASENPATSTFTHQLTAAQAQAVAALVPTQNGQAQETIRSGLAALPGWPAGLAFDSLVALPLLGGKNYYGVLVLLKAEARGFDADDLGILNTFTSQTVLSIENLQLVADSLSNQRTQEELKIVAQVQDSLIPKNLPTDDWFDIATHSLAAKEMGGDFYDFLLLPGRRLAVLIGDVSGKGVTAAFHMAQMKGIFHALMQANHLARNEREQFPLPSRFMSQANTALSHCLEPACFITSSLYIIDYEQGGFMFARAGHCPTLYYHAMREEVSYFVSAGLGLGILRQGGYDRHINNQFYDYGPGDVMVLYTDGIVEARGSDGSEFGEDRLKELLERCYYLEANEIKDLIMADFNEFTAGCPVHDDQTMLVIKFKTAQPEPAS